MRPTGSNAASAASSSHTPRSRKSSLTETHSSNVTSGPPTTFFIATEDQIMGTSMQGAATDRKSTTSEARRTSSGETRPASLNMDMSTDRRPVDHRLGVSDSQRGRAQDPADSVYGVRSLEEALGEAFGDKSKEEQQSESSNGGLAALLGLKRRKTITSMDGNEKTTIVDDLKDWSQESTRHTSPRDTYLFDHRTRQSSRGPTPSQPLTPLQLQSPAPNSAIPSTPKSGSFRSLHLSDEDEGTEDGASQAIASSGEEEDDYENDHGKVDKSGSVMTELVMPSLSMPARRPFTAKGKQMGRLKVCVAGPAGVGKTSLIRAIFQQCQDIVHIDPIATNLPSTGITTPPRTRSKGKKVHRSKTTHITEIHASTKAYPAWWSELEESRVLRRRKSTSDTVLERNICFIDTPGSSPIWSEEHVVRYIETLFLKNASITTLSESELMNALCGSGGVQVDAVIYVLPHEWTRDEHITHLGRLSSFTNVIPVFSKGDLVNDEEIGHLKRKLVNDLECNGHRTFSFARPSYESQLSGTVPESETSSSRSTFLRKGPPFAVSCLPGSDDHEMDASLLMSPSYSPPLVTSDLEDLVSQLFDPDNIAHLRHSAVRKFIAWKQKKASEAAGAGGALSSGDPLAMGYSANSSLGIRDHFALARKTPSSPSRSQNLVQKGRGQASRRSMSPSSSSPFNMSSTALIGTGLPEFTRARLRDHMFHEERLAEVQMAKWASDLQRSLRKERETFERVAKGERAKWLLERIGEEANQGNIKALSEDKDAQLPQWVLSRRGSGDGTNRARSSDSDLELPSWARGARYKYEEDARDPLGLCTFGDGVSRISEVVIKVLGGGVLVGAVYMAVARAWGWEGRLWGWWGDQ